MSGTVRSTASIRRAWPAPSTWHERASRGRDRHGFRRLERNGVVGRARDDEQRTAELGHPRSQIDRVCEDNHLIAQDGERHSVQPRKNTRRPGGVALGESGARHAVEPRRARVERSRSNGGDHLAVGSRDGGVEPNGRREQCEPAHPQASPEGHRDRLISPTRKRDDGHARDT